MAPPAGAARFLLSRRPPDPVREATRWPCSHVAREGAMV